MKSKYLSFIVMGLFLTPFIFSDYGQWTRPPWSDDDGPDNQFHVYFNHSIKNEIEFNLTESDASEINTSTSAGYKHIFGGTFQ